MDDQQNLRTAEAIMASHLAAQQKETARALHEKNRQNRFFLGMSLFVLATYATFVAYRYSQHGRFDLISGVVLVLLCAVVYKRGVQPSNLAPISTEFKG